MTKSGYVNAYGRDITQRKKAEEELRSREELLRTVMESADDLIFVQDLDGKYLYYNGSPRYGLTAENVVGKMPHDYLDKETADRIMGDHKQIISTGQRLTSESQMNWKNETYHLHNLKYPVKNETGQVKSVVTISRNITERKKAENALHGSEERYRSLFASSREGILIFGPDGKIMRVNNAAAAMLDYDSPEELVGVPAVELYLDPKAREAMFNEIMEKGYVENYELTAKKKDGSPIHIISSNLTRVDEEGNVLQTEAFFIDITERKKADLELIDSEEKYKGIFELAPDGIVTANRRGVITSVNSAFLSLTGFSEEEIVGKNFTKIGTIRMRDIPRYIKIFSSFLRGKTSTPMEFEYLRKDGTLRWGEAHSGVLKEGGKTVGFQAILRDITERKKASEIIKASEEKYRRLIELAPDGIVTMDVNGVIASRNTAASRISGYPSGELIGKHFAKLGDLPLEDLPKMEELFTSAMKGKETAPFEVNLLRKDGSPYVAEVNIGVLKEKGKTTGLQVILRDVTERKKIFRKLATLNEKLGVVGGLTRHDINNKLATVRANVYLAKQGLTGDHQAYKYLSEIDSAVGQAERIFDFAKSYEGLGVEELEYVDVGDAFEGACKQFSGLNLRVVNGCGGLRVLADSMLSRLFYNLIDNSLKHGEKVTKISVCYEDAKDKVHLVYEDKGVGIPPAEKEKIFEQGYGKGSGLGLYLIMKMCEVYGWAIKETGKPNKGARFVMTLPKTNMDEGKASYELQ